LIFSEINKKKGRNPLCIIGKVTLFKYGFVVTGTINISLQRSPISYRNDGEKSRMKTGIFLIILLFRRLKLFIF
jgi:hypothetical protein